MSQMAVSSFVQSMQQFREDGRGQSRVRNVDLNLAMRHMVNFSPGEQN